MRLIDESTFEGCRSLKYIDLPTKLVKIGRRAFKGCSSLASLILPVGTQSIGFDAFADCSSLERIAIPKDVKDLEDEDVFGGCDSLKEISFGAGKSEWDTLMRGKTLTVRLSDATLRSPSVTFMNLK
jgi:hypothetical protein